MTIRIDGSNTTANPGITGADADTGLQFGTNEVKIVTGGSDRVTVDSSGKAGIGTASPQSRLHIDGAEDATGGIVLSAGAQNHQWFLSSDFVNVHNIATSSSAAAHTWQTNGLEKVRIDSSGRLLVGTSSWSISTAGVAIYNPGGDSGRIDVIKTQSGVLDSITNFHNGSYVGGLTYSNTATALVTSSDIRLKKDITGSPDATPVVDTIRIVSHGWINDEAQVKYGIVAQELYQAVPDAVRVGDDGADVKKTWGVDYSKLVPILVKALQESNQRIETLETEVQALKGGINP
jgi:hypothetical protein